MEKELLYSGPPRMSSEKLEKELCGPDAKSLLQVTRPIPSLPIITQAKDLWCSLTQHEEVQQRRFLWEDTELLWGKQYLKHTQSMIIRRGPVGKSRGLFLGLNWIVEIMPTRLFSLWQRTPWTWALLLSSALQCLQWIGFIWMKHFPYGKLLWCL